MEGNCRCPICGKQIIYEYWTCPYGIEEEHVKCDRCGYYYEFLYGGSLELIGNKVFMDSGSENPSSRALTQRRRNKALFMAKRRWRKHKKGITAKCPFGY